jgi:hypothetical protein
MFDDDSLEELGCHSTVPYTLWINDHDGTSCANAKAGSFTTLHARRSEEQIFALE